MLIKMPMFSVQCWHFDRDTNPASTWEWERRRERSRDWAHT